MSSGCYSAVGGRSHPDEHHVCCFNSDISACANGDAHICLGQSWRVVHAISHHGHTLPCQLQLLHLRHFVRWQDLSKHLPDANLQTRAKGNNPFIYNTFIRYISICPYPPNRSYPSTHLIHSYIHLVRPSIHPFIFPTNLIHPFYLPIHIPHQSILFIHPPTQSIHSILSVCPSIQLYIISDHRTTQ